MSLAHKIQALLKGQNLFRAQKNLANRYREGAQNAQGFRHEEDRLAYLASRMMATASAVEDVLLKLPQDFQPHTFLDLGCGPGTASWVAKEIWPHLSCTLVDSDQEMLDVAKKILGDKHQYTHQSISHPLGCADLVMMSYVLTELLDFQTALKEAWQATKEILVIIVPGTPQAFQKLLMARNFLILEKGFLFAPCPNSLPCPMENTKDWCHFGVKFDRPEFHQQAKQGTMGWELEKYSYMIFSKTDRGRASGRIVHQPLHGSGHGYLDVCQDGKISRQTFSRKQGDVYKRMKKLTWGDSF